MTDIERIKHMIADRESEIAAAQYQIAQSDQIQRGRVDDIIRMRREIDTLYVQLSRCS